MTGSVTRAILGAIGLDEAMAVLQFCGAAPILADVIIVSVKPARPD